MQGMRTNPAARAGSERSTSRRAFRAREARSPRGPMLLPVKNIIAVAATATSSLTPRRRSRVECGRAGSFDVGAADLCAARDVVPNDGG